MSEPQELQEARARLSKTCEAVGQQLAEALFATWAFMPADTPCSAFDHAWDNTVAEIKAMIEQAFHHFEDFDAQRIRSHQDLALEVFRRRISVLNASLIGQVGHA